MLDYINSVIDYIKTKIWPNQSLKNRLKVYVTVLETSNNEFKANFIYNNRKILDEIPTYYSEIYYIKKQINQRDNFKYFAPEILTDFVIVVGACVFLKTHGVEPKEWHMYVL